MKPTNLKTRNSPLLVKNAKILTFLTLMFRLMLLILEKIYYEK